MEYRVLPHGGEKISIIGMVSSVIGARPEDEIIATVRAAVENGVNFFDMAGGHAAIFEGYGKALEGIRDKVYLQVHFGANYTTGEYGWTTNLDEVKASVKWQMERLRTDYIDFGFIHCLDEDKDLTAYQASGVLDYVLELKKQGVIRHIGLSSHTPALVNRVLDMGILDIVMFSINPVYDYGQGKSYEDSQRFFDEELARCGVEYFDVFMLHWLNGKNYEIAEQYNQFRFLREKKAEGTAKRIGFSYHDSASLLDKILTAHPEVDVVQLQINYLDWDTAGIESGRCYETCVRHGKKVIVMEPVKGGTLASLPEDAQRHLKSMHPDWTPADWALRFAQSLPEVEICLSGMSAIQQVEENLRRFEPLTEDEISHLLKARPLIEQQTAIACTGCFQNV